MTTSSKYLNLEKAKQAGIATPKTLLLENHTDKKLNDFLNDSPLDNSLEPRFIVRSIQSCEDGANQSLAGHFWSSNAIFANEVADTILLAQTKNQAILKQLGIKQAPQLMLQTFIEHSFGGVLFSPWSFFCDFALVDYSTESVQNVVNGQSETAMISLNPSTHSPLPLPDELAFLNNEIRNLNQQLTSLFDFPLDCEWAINSQTNKIILLQVRPQTRLIGPLFSINNTNDQQLTLPSKPSKEWQYSALSESLGKLSPLSFSLLEQLYKDARAGFQALGYKAKQVDFMQQMPDGTVLVDSVREKSFYSPTRLGGFWKSFKAPTWQQKIKQAIQAYLKNKTAENSFSYPLLSELFEHWMISNLLSNGSGRNTANPVHAYELAWQNLNTSTPQTTILETENNKSDWHTLNHISRTLFFNELEKLKQKLASNPHQLFNTWEDYSADKGLEKAKTKQQTDAPFALYDYSSINTNINDKIESIGAKKAVTGTLFIIDNPARFNQTIPADSIVVAPYFNNQWVHDIQHISAIFVEKGGRLAHSAIVAREFDVPYFIIKQSSLGDLQTGQQVNVSLDGELTPV